jgi:hypothetical protein
LSAGGEEVARIAAGTKPVMVAVGARAARAQGSPPQIREDLVGRAAGQGGILECLRAFWYCPNAVGVGIGGGQARGRVRAQISHVARARPAEPGDGASPGPCERPRRARGAELMMMSGLHDSST